MTLDQSGGASRESLRLDDALLQEYIDSFYGYGNYRGSCWLIGMEEGGGDSVTEVRSRLAAWQKRGKPELDDVAGFHSATGLDKWFRPNPPLQPTWAKLIRLAIAAHGLPVTTAAVRAFQGGTLGRSAGTNCILELLPLPSPSSNSWPYSGCSDIPCLRERATYRELVAPLRVQHLRQRIQENQPSVVVFYGLGYRDWWEHITDKAFEPSELEGFLLARTVKTLFALTRHPAHRGVTNHYFETAGTVVRGLVPGLGGEHRFPHHRVDTPNDDAAITSQDGERTQ